MDSIVFMLSVDFLPLGKIHIFINVIPIILSQTVYQISGVIDIALFSNIMKWRGVRAENISIAQGIYSTKYRLLVSVPIAISTAMAASMLPNLAEL